MNRGASAMRVPASMLLAVLVVGPALAQAPSATLPADPPLPPLPGATSSPPSPAQPADPDALPPYEPQLERLAERLGTLSLMRELCGTGDAAEFRNRMAALLDAEARSAQRRERLAGAFNRGVRGYAASYRSCTASARSVMARVLAEADRLTRDLAARYGGT